MARGSITPRPTNDGKVRYRIKWESRAPDGTRKHHSATRSTKRAAEAFLAEKLDEVANGTFVQPTKETLNAFLERWITVAEVDWSEATAYKYRSIIKCQIAPYLGAVPLDRLDELTIQACYSQLLAAGYAAGTVGGVHSILDSALSQAVAWRILPRNPADGVKAPTYAVPAPTVWTQEEAAMFLRATEGDRFAPLWRLGLDSGMRLGEMLSVTWRDLDLDRAVVAVRRTLTRARGGGWKIGELAKTKSSRRSITLGTTTIAALRAHRVRQHERRLACGGAWIDLGLVFDRGNGRWIDPIAVRTDFQRSLTKIELPEITPHGMRHTMATLLLEAGTHPKIVQERLGHKSIQVTLDRYSHVSLTMQQDAAAVLDSILGGMARPIRGQDAI